jgi:hypothetical protein
MQDLQLQKWLEENTSWFGNELLDMIQKVQAIATKI